MPTCSRGGHANNDGPLGTYRGLERGPQRTSPVPRGLVLRPARLGCPHFGLSVAGQPVDTIYCDAVHVN
jgi:hypothetical protein